MRLKDEICNGCRQYRKSMFDNKEYCLLVSDSRTLMVDRETYCPHVPKNCEMIMEYTVLSEGKAKFINRSLSGATWGDDFNYECLVRLLKDSEYAQYNSIMKINEDNNYFIPYDDVCLIVYRTIYGGNVISYTPIIERLIINSNLKNIMIYGASYGCSDKIRRNLKKKNGKLYSSIRTNEKMLDKHIGKICEDDEVLDIAFLPHNDNEGLFSRYELDMFEPIIEKNWKMKKPFFLVVYG